MDSLNEWKPFTDISTRDDHNKIIMVLAKRKIYLGKFSWKGGSVVGYIWYELLISIWGVGFKTFCLSYDGGVPVLIPPQ